ncbi:universal stress protein [Allobranchiibius sp. CTAmp26]|uniref:universal stress protein n=1 Tax=Allobranchiibius sp. CTAmp26 TaxID=2815214 RepID=UPI001AA0D83B|nr:universal stress protein [Allobranchiibius sp. CTAmp26]MBO1756807.1 universal stress protein [Allobranchiibius sp. CTAmp26]
MTADGAPPRVVIVVGVDGSDSSIHAGAYAVGMARRMDATLVAVYVHTLGVYAAAAPAAIPLLRETQAGVVADMRRQVAESGIVDDLDFEMVERHGNPYKEIVAVATERRADAVVVGASSHAGHRLVGSLAVHLVRDAKWPVTVVP